ncbi:hypothetical protein PHISP_04362 [Aspergillus sp. HF37]|nr:hypothetical protein PHISP_04362 [Aspergillus sp. HF37]
MKLAALITLASACLSQAYIPGFDISNHQGSVDFAAAKSDGARFVMIKATEGTYFIDSWFDSHYTGATNVGLIRGGYHFAIPNGASGATQANYFLQHGGGWSGDGRTLPGMVDLEYNPYGATCYGLSASAMVDWIRDFSDTYKGKTGRYPMIYTTADWWSQCTGNSGEFGSTNPLVLANWGSSPGTIPGSWPFESFWQYNNHYKYGGDSDYWNGSEENLKKFATS